jgi:drug/metabolite transporter superfamily protein YnfA
MDIARSVFFFLLAGLCEIGGGYMMWLWIRDGRGLGFALLGAAILVIYWIIPTIQPASFGRVMRLMATYSYFYQFSGDGRLTGSPRIGLA